MPTRKPHRIVAAGVVLFAVVQTASFRAAGKPGYPDKIVWSGVTWDIKTSHAPVGPGPNVFDKSNVTVDDLGGLHLRIAKNASGAWTSAEIIGPTSYGYGTYTFTLGSRVDNFDPNVVLGLFTWSDRAAYAHREIDIEFARWGYAADPTNAQYVVQPYNQAGHLKRFAEPPATISTHRFSWQPGRVDWESYDAAGGLIDSYVYSGTDVPRAGDERVHLNFWLFGGGAPTDGMPAEAIVTSFTFTP
jgi:hypothetical protein